MLQNYVHQVVHTAVFSQWMPILDHLPLDVRLI